jgi:4-hydroxybenzoate polyprenyltransferase/phosphoserine phosphatase
LNRKESEKPAPVFVDLDGTVLKTDLLLESVAVLAKTRTYLLFMLPVWLMSGKANLKARIAAYADIDVSALPYNDEVLSYLESKKQEGHRLVLASASNTKYVEAVFKHLEIFDDFVASSETENLSGSRKLAAIQHSCGDSPFSYVGNGFVDLKVWGSAAEAVVVSNSKALAKKARSVSANVHVLENGTKSQLRPFLKAIRPHQWAKNVLIFLPLAASHRIDDVGLIVQSLLAFVAFSLCASSVYLLNDMLDLASDRKHGIKRNRPFAAGSLSLLYGYVGAPILLAVSFSLALLLPTIFILVLFFYYLVTLAYSFRLKRVIVLDVLTLAGLYTLRLISGAAATAVELSFWLLAFSMFLFLSLALLKRCSELLILEQKGKAEAHGRGYSSTDYLVLNQLGVSSGLISVLVLALYINSQTIAQLYAEPRLIWLLCPIVLYWIGRIWVKGHRGDVDEDPIVFAAKDQRTYWLVLISGVVVVAATVGIPLP